MAARSGGWPSVWLITGQGTGSTPRADVMTRRPASVGCCIMPLRHAPRRRPVTHPWGDMAGQGSAGRGAGTTFVDRRLSCGGGCGEEKTSHTFTITHALTHPPPSAVSSSMVCGVAANLSGNEQSLTLGVAPLAPDPPLPHPGPHPAPPRLIPPLSVEPRASPWTLTQTAR